MTADIQALEEESYLSAREAIYRQTDRLFAWLMAGQWIFGMAFAFWLSPVTWKGASASIHPHVWAAIFLGGIIAVLPIFMAVRFPGKLLTRHSFAIGQMLYGALLIHLSGGRIETHFHIFGSLAFLAFYRDSWVLVTASLVVLADHFLRGMFWPESVYGAIAAPMWRSLEHTVWVIFEDVFLIVAIRKSLNEMRRAARREAELEFLNVKIETKVQERTRELADSEERFSQLADNSPDVFWFIDLNPPQIRYVSPSVETQWGVTPDKFYADPHFWLKCVPTDDRRGVLAAIAEADARKKTTLECDHRVVLPNEEVRWVHFRGTLTRNAAGKAVRLGGLTRDVTEQVLAEEQTRLDAQRLRLAVKAGGVGIWEYDLVTGNLEWDDEAYRLYGVSREGADPGFLRWRNTVLPEDLERTEASLKHCVEAGVQLDTEFRIQRPSDGGIRQIRAMATTIKDDTGKPVRVIGTNWDVTEDRMREATLRNALQQQTQLTDQAQAGELAKREFLAAMSHEIRTPLGGILGFADALLETKELPVEAIEYAQTIREEGQALMRIINDILDFSRIGAGKMRVEKERFSPVALSEDIRKLFSHEARTKGLFLNIETAEKTPQALLGDAGRIRQILINLVGNAIKFTTSGGIKILVRPVEASDGIRQITFRVEDTGPGIDSNKLPSIFDPFTQADFSNARKYGGVGLGLAISSKLAELMGGTLEGKNSSNGATFILSLPLEEIAAPECGKNPPALNNEWHLDLTGKLLIAEDNRITRALLLRMAREWPVEVFVASDGAEAVEMFRKEQPACIIMDVQMPVMDGIEATKLIREIEKAEKRPPAYIVALTADVMPENRAGCMEAGMDAYLNKPVNKTELAAALHSGLLKTSRCMDSRLFKKTYE